jgi:hypothetical protein
MRGRDSLISNTVISERENAYRCPAAVAEENGTFLIFYYRRISRVPESVNIHYILCVSLGSHPTAYSCRSHI